MLQNFFWRKSRKPRFLYKTKHQEYAILKAINSFRAQFCITVQIQTPEWVNFFQRLNYGEIRFPQTKFSNINYRLGIEFDISYPENLL